MGWKIYLLIMDLKNQLILLTSTTQDTDQVNRKEITLTGNYWFIWKDEQELLQKIKDITNSFIQPVEDITPAKTITYHILNMYKDRFKTYDGMNIDMSFIDDLKMDSNASNAVKKAVTKIISEQDAKKGNFCVRLDVMELYQLFSLEEFRKSQLNIII